MYNPQADMRLAKFKGKILRGRKKVNKKLLGENPKNDDETFEEYEDRINKLGEEWLASDNAKNEEDR
jgi:hypothetical protein